MSMVQWFVFEIKNIFSIKNLHVPEIFLNDILFNGKSESQIKTLGRITITKEKVRDQS